jgi:poly-beta-1,6 N-acetyl-D-glucosamine synthase
MSSSPVFFDPSGRRGRAASRAAIVLGLLVAVASTVFILSLTSLSSVGAKARRTFGLIPPLPSYDQRKAAAVLAITKNALKAISLRPQHESPTKTNSIVLGYYAPWQQSGLESLRVHAKNLTHLAPAWLSLSSSADGFNLSDYDLTTNPGNREVIQIAKQYSIQVFPVLANNRVDAFDSAVLTKLFSDPGKESRLIDQVVDFLANGHYPGLNLDFEMIPEDQWDRFVEFVAKLHQALEGHGMELSADLEAGLDPARAEQVVDELDWAVLMLYDEHGSTDSAGPIASLPWTADTLSKLLQRLPERKVVMGIGNYAYDWPSNGPAQSLTFEDAMATASGYRDQEDPSDVIAVDSDSANPRFEYDDEKGSRHTVWMLDAVTAYNQWRLGHDAGLRGAGLWVLGSEDPAIWGFLDRAKMDGSPSSAGLDKIHFPYEVDFVGKGEILSVKARPNDGQRKVEFDPDTRDAVDWTYNRYAFPYVLQKRGYKPKTLVLTFDDGPDSNYTSQILDELKALGIHATFFVIGENAEAHPDLVQRMYEEGNEVGSHSFTHPNLGTVGRRRAELELNATQRAIEAILGRSTRIFRPPYNADSQPQTREQVVPIEIADKLSYITVGENVDPLDWDTTVHLPDGSTRSKTGQEVADAVVQNVLKREGTDDEGNVILLHDAGGDRSATVAALKILVPALQKHGYRFGLVSDLLGTTRANLMPPIPADQLTLVGVDRVVFTTTFWIDRILTLGFILAIIIGLSRSVLITLLAFVSNRLQVLCDVRSSKSVTVVIAAFNEQVVIANTVRSILASNYPLREVIVVDDGSTDGTALEVENSFADSERVRVVRKENGGKASALNVGISEARGEIIVGVDADTNLDPEAIGLMVRHFNRESVAAVAGNVKVGNAENVLTRWQALEYTSSQNVDRRAYGLLNCITVVPGAIGAWRRSAVQEVGGYQTDTLAEDMDLTWRLRENGYRLVNEPQAKAYTEAPESVSAFFKQRFRWAYGTLQCLMKHRRATFRNGWFGWFALPSLWVFQVIFQVLAPIMDLKMLLLVISVGVQLSHPETSKEISGINPAFIQLESFGILYGLFFTVELIAAWLAYSWDRGRRSDLWYLFLQRFVYRQMMYGVVVKSLWRAINGGRQGWSKLNRTGTVRVG